MYVKFLFTQLEEENAKFSTTFCAFRAVSLFMLL